MLNYCLLDKPYFTYAQDNFIIVISLYDRRLTAPNITEQLNNVVKKIYQHALWEEDSEKLAYMAELLSRNLCLGSKTISKDSSRPRHTKTGQ